MTETETKTPETPAKLFGLVMDFAFFSAIVVALLYILLGATWEMSPPVIMQKLARAGFSQEVQQLVSYAIFYAWALPWAWRNGDKARRAMWQRLRAPT